MHAEINTIKDVCNECSIQPLVFIEKYSNFENNKAMMDQAFEEISRSDILIAELSQKSIGVGIELGYAKALHKPVVYVMKTGSECSTTAGGASDHIIEYSCLKDLKEQLYKTLKEKYHFKKLLER